MTGNANNNRIYLNRKITKLFIQLYKEQECLYNPSHAHYHKRIEKNRSLNAILHEIQKFVPDLQLDNIRTKIKTIRTQFAHELTVIEAMELAGIPYRPKLWCFKYLNFLRKFMSRLSNREEMSAGDSDSNDGGKSFYSELIEKKLTRRPAVPRLTNFKWTQEMTAEYIKFHKMKECLYDINHPDFRDREKRDEARQQLLDEMKIIAPWITMQDIWLKHKCIRDQYVKELRHMTKAKADNIPYVPKLWCFHQLTYLRPYNGMDATSEKAEDSDNPDAERKMEVLLDNVCSFTTHEDSNIDDVANTHDEASGVKQDSNIEDSDDGEDSNNSETDEDTNHSDYTMHDDTDSERNETDSNHFDLSDHSNAIAEDEIEYEESVLKSENCSYVEILPFECEPNKHDIPDLKRKKSTAQHVKIERVDNNSTMECQNIKLSQKNKETRHSDYDWLANLVTSQLDEISPSYRSEFAWDIQCLVRKYVLKSKTSDNSRISVHSSENFNENIILPRSTSLNISFL